MTRIQDLLRQAEIEAETTSATVRFIIFLALTIAVLTAAGGGKSGWNAALAVSLYGAVSAVGMLLAWRRIFHPAIPVLFVTFDIVLVVAHVLMLTKLMEAHPASPFALPAASLIFVILIHASMRYRPWLIIYAATLFVASIEAGARLVRPETSEMAHAMPSMPHDGMVDLLHYEVLPVVLISLAAFVLFVTARRTRRMLMNSLEQVTKTARLSRYFSPNLAASLAEAEGDGTLIGRRVPVAVLFVDIRGFTALGEAMTPEDLGAFLSAYRDRLTRPVFQRGGTVDKFIGDAIMAVFGSPFPREDDAARAVHCALDMLEAVHQWSEERRMTGAPSVSIGIGVHYGEVFAGALGNDQLLEFTVIGDTVNVAERLERVSREVGSPVVVSAALLDAAGDRIARDLWRPLPIRELRGHRQIVETFCLVEAGAAAHAEISQGPASDPTAAGSSTAGDGSVRLI